MNTSDRPQGTAPSGRAVRTPLYTVQGRSRRMLLAWSASTLPVTPLLLLGFLLGEHGLELFTERVLSVIDPAVPVALGALGILLGLSIPGRAFNRVTAAAAGGETVLTIGVVGAGLHGAIWAAGPAVPEPLWFIPLFGGLCAAASLTLPGRNLVGPRRLDEGLVESEVALMIVLSGLTVAAVRMQSVVAGSLVFAQGCGVAALLAMAGWLLVRRTASNIEARVFAFAALLLIGGAADYLSFSSLLGGLVAGLLWHAMGGVSRERLERETMYVQHPFVVLVLLVAGARADLTALTMGLGAAYAVIRLATRRTAAAILRRVLPGVTPALGFRLIDPGIFGVALALTVTRALGAEAAAALSVVVVGTILSDIALGLASPRSSAE